ncbi:rhodanese-like domain-containing protein [Silvimonas sp.]|uniref:rhodanese-like domain-containing protein n=1 Tax=Silvimonas sp. TaxID=2650811 RepID=UPI0028433BEE|nr:rhodanese-like domain-containing protein [Silvimonas sp.]MDR3430152.1 rhodanese-like domain-containing protein [Silvimonas sp.]
MDDQFQYYSRKLQYEIDAADLMHILKTGKKVVIVDARSPEAFLNEHIPGAISFPHRQMYEHTTDVLARDVLYVTYCDGIGCNASTKGALQLARLGFEVRELIGGLDWFKRDGYATEGLLAPTQPVTEVVCAC